jgi:hypothetical protein
MYQLCYYVCMQELGLHIGNSDVDCVPMCLCGEFGNRLNRKICHRELVFYFLIVVSAGRAGVSTGKVEVSAGDKVEGSLVESSSASLVLLLSLHAVRIVDAIRKIKIFFIFSIF